MTSATVYKVSVHDRNYTTWDIVETTHFQKVELNLPILENKLFSNDVFTVDKSGKVELLHSSIRTGGAIPGVLLLEGNKTYGQKGNGTNKKNLYKCVPDDTRLPAFLVPYEIKQIGFSKVFSNIYVTFTFTEWLTKHPHGTLSHLIGCVEELPNFYEYQLFCKSLNASIQKFQRATVKSLERGDLLQTIAKTNPLLQNRESWHIFSIDPAQSLDYDDAFGIILNSDGTKQLSIYISNVTIWMDALKLWDSFSQRISTIYLPDKKRPMLPTLLSEGLCSLQEKKVRFAFVLDVFISSNGDKILDMQFHNCSICVKKNYAYEEPALLNSEPYQQLLATVKELSSQWKYTNSIKTSHDVVCYLMVWMNYWTAKKMLEKGCGIFRSALIKGQYRVPEHLPEEVVKFMKMWNSSGAQYIDLEKDVGMELKHELLEVDAYIHITSPIRRLVDLLNMIQFQKVYGLITFSQECSQFYNKWLEQLDYINTTMRSIRKVQCECSLLDLCCNNQDVLNKEYDGFLFDRLERNDGLYQYIVYLPELKLSSRITLRDNFDNFAKKNVRIHLFHDEERFKRKIRLEVL
jgi:exoribonuclease R